MDFSDYLWIKFFVLVGLAFFGNLFYTIFTGKSLEQERNDRESAQPDQQEH